MPVLWHQDRSSNLDKAQIFVVLLPFFKRPVLSSLQRRAGSGTDCPTIHSGGRKCRGRALLSREGGNVGVVPGVAGEGVQKRPPRTKSPSRYKITLRRCLRERVAGVSTRSGGCIRLWRVEMSWEGRNVGVAPGAAGKGVQNRPPRTKSPSRNRNTLQRGEGDKNTLQGRLG